MVFTRSQLQRIQKVKKNLEVIPVVFHGPNKEGDFLFEITSNHREKCLWIFNDNANDHFTSKRGGGNACIRPFNKYGVHKKSPKSAGISTGDLGRGYTDLVSCKDHIDTCIQEIDELILTGNYTTLCYSCESATSRKLGTGIFNVNDQVKDYITEKIIALGTLV